MFLSFGGTPLRSFVGDDENTQVKHTLIFNVHLGSSLFEGMEMFRALFDMILKISLEQGTMTPFMSVPTQPKPLLSSHRKVCEVYACEAWVQRVQTRF